MTAQLAASSVAGLAGVASCWHLRHTPEPPPDPDGFAKPRYHDLVGRRFVVLALACALLLSLVDPSPGPRLAWALAAGCGGVLALCDQATTYLPSRVLRPWWALTWLAVAIHVAGGVHPMQAAERVATCTAACTLLFWGLWRLRAGMGFADVRLVAVLSALTSATSVRSCISGLFAGTLLGALAGLATSCWRRRHPSPLGGAFAYGPALFLGAWVSLLLPR